MPSRASLVELGGKSRARFVLSLLASAGSDSMAEPSRPVGLPTVLPAPAGGNPLPAPCPAPAPARRAPVCPAPPRAPPRGRQPAAGLPGAGQREPAAGRSGQSSSVSLSQCALGLRLVECSCCCELRAAAPLPVRGDEVTSDHTSGVGIVTTHWMRQQQGSERLAPVSA